MLKSRASEPAQQQIADINSNLLPQLFERLVVNRQLQILDLCGARSATINLFSNFNCRLYVADICDEDFVIKPDEEATHEELVEQFREAMGLADDCILDLCFFWDLFNYLDAPALSAFLEALEPHVGPDTRAFAVGILNARTQLPNYRYGIRQLNQIEQKPNPQPQLPVYQHSQREMNSLLGYLAIDKSRLLSDGRVEYILNESRGGRGGKKIFDF